MAISAYFGVPGSGKTYEVVKSVILPAFLSGRRIVTNVEGVNDATFRTYALTVKKMPEQQLGAIIKVTDQDVINDNFFPFKNQNSLVKTVCNSGDLIAIDEVWRIWSSDTKIPENHRSFIAEHRHFTDETTGLCCDLVVINQSIANLPRFLKDRIETSYRMTKHVALGLRKRYRVDIFTGVKVTKNNKVTSYQEKYNTEIFDLYKSYDGVNGKESITDSRQSILSNKRVYCMAIFLLLMVIFCIYLLKNFLNSYSTNDEVKAKPVVSNQATQEKKETVKKTAKPQLSTKWRVAGRVRAFDNNSVILISNTGEIRLENGSDFTINGYHITGVVDGELVTRYSGQKDKKQ